MTAKGRKALKITGNVLFFTFIGLICLVIVLSIYAKSNKKLIFTYSFLWVMTDSMETEIPEKSYILVKKASAKDVNVGDVITFIDPTLLGNYNTHRVVEIIGDHEEFVTKGDKSEHVDEHRVKAENVVAKYVCRLPILTFFGRLYSSPLGLYITAGVIVVGAGIYIALAFRRARIEEKNKEMDRLVEEEVKRLEESNGNPFPEMDEGYSEDNKPKDDNNDNGQSLKLGANSLKEDKSEEEQKTEK